MMKATLTFLKPFTGLIIIVLMAWYFSDILLYIIIAFNYQGIGASHWLIMLPAFIVPLLIYLPFKWFGSAQMGLLVLGGLGVAGLAFRKFFAQAIHNNLQERKYIMSAGFREKN